MKPSIVVLDSFTLSPLEPGESSATDPSWDALASLGNLVIHHRTKPEEVVARAENAEVLLTNKVILNGETIVQLPRLKYIGVMATGTNVVDLDAAKARGIVVTNVPGYSLGSVAQAVFALLLELVNRTGETSRAVADGRWATCQDFCFTLAPFPELAGKTFGIIGYGAIGQAVARIVHGFEMQVLVHSRTEKPSPVPVEWVPIEELFSRSDVISLHCPLTPETEKMICRESIARMKRGALLVNTSRGPLVDEAALAEALHAGRLGGYGADVLTKEPPPSDNPLLSTPRTVITPHMAWASIEARHRLMHQIAENLKAFLTDKPTNVVV